MLTTLLAMSGGASVEDSTSFALTHVAIGLPMLVTGVLGLLIALGLFLWVRSQDRGTRQMQELSDAIQVCALHRACVWLGADDFETDRMW